MPNQHPFRTDPRTPKLGHRSFWGWEPLMHRIKTLLTEPQHSASISAAESPVLWQKFAVQNAGRPNAEYDRGLF